MSKYVVVTVLLIIIAGFILWPPEASGQPKQTGALPDTVITVLTSKGLKSSDVALYKDYKDTNGNTAIYKVKSKPGEYIAIIQSSPVTTPNGEVMSPYWAYSNGLWYSQSETFDAVVMASGQTSVTLPYGNFSGEITPGANIYFSPEVYLDGKLQKPKGSPIVYSGDILGNGNYAGNCLVWDYGCCLRVLRLIEGQLQGRWLFYSIPKGIIHIDYHQSGDFSLKLGECSKGNDSEDITPQYIEAMSDRGWPVDVSDTLTVYPDGDPETNSVDGELYWDYDYPTDWAAIHDDNGSSGHVGHNDSSAGVLSAQLHKYYAGWNVIRRLVYSFDTSALGVDSVISGAVLSLYGAGKADTGSWLLPICIVSHDTISNNDLVNADYDYTRFGSTIYSQIAYLSYNTAGYNDFTLNSSGLLNISKTGTSKFGVMLGGDVTGIEPDTSNTVYSEYIYAYGAEKGDGYKPTLVVTYTVLSPPTVSTGCPGSISNVSALLYGNILTVGDSTVTTRGFYYGTSGTPTASDSTVTETAASFSTGTYSLTATGLSSSTNYRFRPFAVSASGTGYGSVVGFNTDPLPPASDASDHPYYVRVTAHNSGSSEISERLQAIFNTSSLVSSSYCQPDGSDLVATQATAARYLAATEMDGSASVWLLERETFSAGEELYDLVWMGSGTTTRNQSWIGDADDLIYAVDDSSINAINTFDMTAYIEPADTPTDPQYIIYKPGNYLLSISSTPSYTLTVWQGEGTPVSSGTETVSANGDLQNIESVTGAATHWQAVSTMNDTSYIWESRTTQAYGDLYQISPEIPGGSIITSVDVHYRASIAGDCGGVPPATVYPVIYSITSGYQSGSPAVAAGVFDDYSHTFTFSGSSDLSIGVFMNNDIGCGYAPMVSELWANVTYTPPDTATSVTIPATIGQMVALQAVYDGESLTLNNLSGGCESDTVALSGTLHSSSDPLYCSMVDANIDQVYGTIDGSPAFAYDFEPNQISGSVIADQSAAGNDLIYALADMSDDITLTVGPVTTYMLSYYTGGYGSGTPSGIPSYIPDAPDDITGDNPASGYTKFPGAALINDALDKADIPRSAFWLSAFFGLMFGFGFLIFGKTRDILGLMVIVIAVVIVQAFARMGLGIIDIIMLFVCFSALYFRREHSRGQL